MANKRATYKVEFSFDGLSLAEQDRLYRVLGSVLSQDLKDHMNIKVTDLIGGAHDIFSNKGTRPDGIVCETYKQFCICGKGFVENNYKKYKEN